jgi:hypothetical protein
VASNEYHLFTDWRVRGRVEDVFDLIRDLPALTRWWPAVYLEVVERRKGDATGVGSVADLRTKGWLPYELRWQSRIVESNPPYGFTLDATGDFEGRGIWRFEQDGEWVNARFDWRLRAEKPGIRELSFALKPIFSANHRWAMARGEESLALELARRCAATEEERSRIPPPPPPTRTALLWVAGMSLAAFLGMTWRMSRRRR